MPVAEILREKTPPRLVVGYVRSAARSELESCMERLTWEQICRRVDCRGRWVALHGCQFDESTGQPTAGEVVDVDDDLAELCQRVRDHHLTACAIQYCGGAGN